MQKIPADRNPQLQWPIPTPTPLAPGYGTYKLYAALITQSGTSDPTATVLFNNLTENSEEIVWTRWTTGTYRGTLAGVFTNGLTVGLINVYGNSSGQNAYAVTARRGTTDYFQITTGSGGALIDALMTNCYLEIKIYN